ncbi:DUF6342 family protein [Kitasatospora sp. NPDC008115]|uniref:DUF6342 family protein n=1 Tax=Kitasatospora sp. NPDC008115 TaxID=3364022 RepID=UPI0036EE6613
MAPRNASIQRVSRTPPVHWSQRVFSTTYRGATRRVIGVLDSDGNLSIAGRLVTDQKNLTN